MWIRLIQEIEKGIKQMNSIQIKFIFFISIFPAVFFGGKSFSLVMEGNFQGTKYVLEDTAYHVDANFAERGFGYTPTISSIKKKYAGKLKESKEAIKNIHDKKLIDTIVILSGEGMKFVFYEQKQTSILTDATITSSLVVLQKGIKIGLTKNQVMKKFPEMAMAMVGADLWQIGNEERTQYFELLFKNNVLKTIKYFNPLD